ncbi:hypothetical protein DEU56DRAFT_271848 [Suillus clintonianus]|uniref:uncharacterized protein n=1 Tax=Suillus clintonianus TaxID=1904413 RepID=UPI001B85CC5E|nr:uncharacterized protein DEU56DRAFT_271848 [Suillus clintonianus]KAG2141948.1 hypothetical protein DEU56DRAFT_271848 [Suillus clintonianus]
MQTANSQVNCSSASDIIGALQNILAHSQQISDFKTPHSRANHIPNTNYPAIELKGECISNIVAERQQQLDTVLLDISGLATVMGNIENLHKQLVEQKNKIIQSMTFYKGLVSSLWRLPTEILSQIFHLCLPEDKYLSPASKQAPMLLTTICRPWREVAMGTPSLWCRLHVEPTGRDWEKAVAFYHSWLKRARGYPLSLAFKCWNSPEHLSLLQPYVKQISSLAIRVYHRSGISENLLNDLPRLPALQELVVQARQAPNFSPMTSISTSRLPSTMRSLDVSDLPVFDITRLSWFNSVWVHLTNVKISTSHPGALLYLLRLCPNLSSLTVRTSSFYKAQILEPLTHANIQSLSIVNHSRNIGCLTGLFNALSLPNLRVFELCYGASNLWSRKVLKAFLARSRCSLESLIFSGQLTVTEVQQAEYIALIPSLNIVVDYSSQHFS